MRNILTGLLGSAANTMMPNVGDTTDLTLLLVLLGVSLVGIIAVIILLARKKRAGKYYKKDEK